MAANQIPIFLQEPFSDTIVTLTSQIATRSGTPATRLVLAGENGALVEQVRAIALGTNVATVLRLYYNSAGTTTYKLIGEATLAATTDSGETVQQTGSPVILTLPSLLFPASNTDTAKTGLRLGPEDALYVALGTAVAAGWNIQAVGGHY